MRAQHLWMTRALWTERVVTEADHPKKGRAVLGRGPSKEDTLMIYLVLLAIVAIPVGLIVWRRRGHDGEVGHDPEGNKDIAGGGPPNQSRNIGPGGPL